MTFSRSLAWGHALQSCEANRSEVWAHASNSMYCHSSLVQQRVFATPGLGVSRMI